MCGSNIMKFLRSLFEGFQVALVFRAVYHAVTVRAQRRRVRSDVIFDGHAFFQFCDRL